ncbi:MAG: hypothetical protein IJ358_02200, partial [Clostridia bacterium]|nr:hypothetical protein [Clostridia bacterium]
AGTYYVILSIFGGSVEVGEIKFEIVSKSQIVNANNAKVDDIEITANTTTSYTLQELQTMYNLQRNNEIYYVVTQYVEGITYKKVDDSYEKMTTDEGGVYYQKLHLTDILWVDYNNANLTITYKYDDGTTLQQIANKLIYGGTTYTLIGSNCNLGNYTFDISNNKFVDEDGKLINTVMYGDNIAYCINEQGERVICCKQNAYLFVDEQNANNILAISIDSTGKTIYNFNYKLSDAISWQGNYYTYDSAINKYTLVTNKVNTPYVANQYYVEDNQFKQLSNIATFELTYSGFGTNLSAGTKYVDNVEYSIEAVFNNNNISTNRVYNIYILPYKVNASTDVLLSSTSYVLYDNGNVADKGLFNINAEKYNNKVASISFGAGEDYEIQTSNYVEDDTQTKYTITFNAKGNNYVSYIPVTLTYSDGSTYSYNAQITVVNSSAVSINYPYNVEDTASASYSTFNASIEEFTKSINNQYDVNDLGAWLGYDVSVDNWTESARIKYDLALKGDIINLTEDKLLNVVRYNAYTYAHITNQAYEDGKYYKYNTSTNNFELVTGDEPSDWGSLNYFVKNVNTQSTIDKVELVAVSSTYASNVENVSESLALNGNTIAISESLDYTGYVLFKVYEKGTSAYGYYALKIVDDEQFDDVTVTAGRRTQTITKQLTSEQPIIEIIRNSGNDISSVAQIGSDLIDTNSTNVYLFMVDNYDNLGEKVLNNIANGKLIENTQVLTPNINIQTIVVAVVIQSGTSLVHVCNYNIVLQPDVDVKTGELIDTVIDGSYYIYKAKNLAYSYENISANTINLSEANYLEVTGTHGGELSSVKFDTSKTYTDVLSFDGNNVRIYNTSTQAYDVVATINGTNLKLIKAIGEINVSFYLELTYSSGFKAYLQITINKYDFNDTTTNFTVGNWNGTDNFENDFKLSTIFGNYTGEYNVEYSTNNGATWESSHSGVNHNTLDKILQFTPSNSEYKVRIKITLTSVVPNISKIIDITVKPNIVATYNQNVGNNPTATRVVPEVVGHTTQNQVGSILGVVITEKTIKIQNTTDATASPVTYMTINVGNFSSVKFSLTTDSGDELRIDENNLYSYFVMDGLQSSVDISDTSDLYFVHSAQDVNLRLNVTVANDNGNYAESYVLYITLPKTYTLSACYKVDGATYETVVNNQQLLLKADDEQSIDNNFFGTSETSVDKVYASRLAITDIYGNQYYGYDNIVALGLLTDGNPNKLNFELDAPSGTNVSSIDNGELTFRRDDNPPTVVLKMTNTTITTPIEYNFLVLTEDTDYSNIKYNEELLQVDSDNDGKLDYISVTFEQLENTTNPFELAYLKYLPNDEIAGQVGWVKTTNTNLTFKFESVTTTTDGYNSKIEVDSIGSLGSMMYNQITVTIITMNGVVGEINLIVTNYSVSYAYNQASSNGYETAYGGTEIGKLTDNYNGTARVTATNIDDVFTSSNYSIEYVGAINGFESHWHFANGLDYSATNTSVVYYNDTKQSILSRSVADNTDVTMIFNVKYSGYVIGRIYYKLMLQNDIKIGLNPNLQSGNSATLYLGSNIYTLSGNETVIDLLQSESGANYNNVFITLEQYSTGNVIKDSNGNVVNKALYNGSNSILSASDVSSYLEFKISNPSQELVDKVRVDTNGKLYITGNPSGSFTLNVTSKNGTGYSESFIITVHQYDNTTAQYNNQINVGQGTGYVSDTQISLFTAKPNADDSGKYAFSSYRLGYGTSGNVTTSILDSDATVSFEVAVFDYGTSVKTIKESTAWESIAPNYIDNSYLYTLPSVKYSTGDSNEYQIVSIRLTVEYNGESKYYYAHYQVYNDINISVNKAYEGDKTITYGYNAWTNGSTITIMDTSNSGMYASVTPVLNVSDSEWANVYASCYTKNDNGTFTQLSGDKPTFENGKYYQLNDVVNNISDYTALIRLPDGTEKQITDLTVSGAKVTGTLPNALFTNQTEFTFILKSVETGASLLEDNWTIKANNTITAIDAMPLRTFFLTSEIGNQNYYNVDIIGIGASYNIFVTGGSYSKVSTVISSLGDGYSLKQVTYKGTSSGNSVFSVEATYYVLVGHSNAISLNSNSGQYYITLTVDDSNIVNNNATIDIAPYVKVWEYVGGFKQVTNASIGVGSSSSSSVTLSGISSYVNTDNPSKTITISGGTASREVEVYFNIMIKAKALNGGQMAYSAMLGNAMGDSTELTETDIDANLALKRELLSLITYNNKAIDVDDNTQISYFTISVSKYSDGYEIVYTYNNEATYIRTLYMALG